MSPEARNISAHVSSGLATSSREFAGRLVIGGTNIATPAHRMSLEISDNRVHIQTHPDRGWPRIDIEVTRHDSGAGSFTVEDIRIQPSKFNSEAGLLYTRVMALAVHRPLSICDEAGRCIELGRILERADYEREVEYLARVFRKLSFLEELFGVEFPLKGMLPTEDIRALEILYFGLTQGEAHTRGDEIVVGNVIVSPEEIKRPPFTGPGAFSRVIMDHVNLLGAQIDVGPIELVLRNAELANKRVLASIRPEHPVDLRFTVLDNQVIHRFESYFSKKGRDSKLKLSQFKENLRHGGEPEELVNSIDESLQNDVQALEATQVAMGWLYLKGFSDRYCAQTPEINESGGCWRVPIHIAFANGQGGPVGDLVVDSRTAIITDCTPPEVMRRRGEAIAKQIFHAEQSPSV